MAWSPGFPSDPNKRWPTPADHIVPPNQSFPTPTRINPLNVAKPETLIPSWLPLANGVAPDIYADFTSEGTTNHYWASSLIFNSFNAWRAALGGTYTRASNATFLRSGAIQTATTGVARFPSDGSGNPLGLRMCGAQTELCLWNRDLTNAAWTATTCTVAKDQIGVDGVAASASSLLATGSNATVLQAITSGSVNRTTGAYVKRLSGSGTINITQDNGATWTPIVPTSSWTFFSITPATLANPTVGFQIVTNGDSIAVDYFSQRGLSIIADVIATTTVTVSQVIDSLSFPFGGGTAFTAMLKAQGLAITNTVNMAYLDSGQNVADIIMYTPAGTKVNYRTLNQVNVLDATGFPASGDVSGTHKAALSGSATSRAYSTDGQTATTDAHALVGTSLSSIFVGLESNATSSIFGNVQQIGLWAGLSGADVASLSALP